MGYEVDISHVECFGCVCCGDVVVNGGEMVDGYLYCQDCLEEILIDDNYITEYDDEIIFH